MTARFAGRVALVTGAARGIGRATALQLCNEGARVVVQDRLESEGRAFADELTAAGHEAMFVGGDAGDPRTADALVTNAIQRFGQIDLLVNNAASSVRRPLLELELDEAEDTFRATFWSAFHVTRRAAREMLRQGSGAAIVMVSSLAAVVPIPAGGVYASAKAAVEQLMRSFAMELAPHGIRVNAVAPGLIDTPGEREVSGAQIRVFASRVPLGRAGTADDIAAAILYLLADDAAYVTGTVLTVDGGMRLPAVRKQGSR